MLPQVLHELRIEEVRQKKLASKRETAKENPSLISGYRELKDGVLTDRTGKRALLDIYQKITS